MLNFLVFKFFKVKNIKNPNSTISKTRETIAERGNIFDRNGNALTRNIAHYTISVNPQKVSDKNRQHR